MKLGAALLLVAYVVAIVTASAVAHTDDATPHFGPTIDRNPVADENRREAQATKIVELRRLAHRRLQVIRNQRLILHRRFAYAPTNWLEQAFLCIHRYEGSWTDTGAPFWGGLQMDGSFMQSYGGEFWRRLGTADAWPPSVQIAVAIKAWFTRGFRPWPTTARRCGLL